MAEYIDGGLEARDRAEVEAHLAGCEACYEGFAETVQFSRSEPLAPAGRPVLRARLGLVAAAVLVLAGLSGAAWWNSAPQVASRQVQAIASAAVTERPALGRLSNPFPWKPAPEATRGGSDTSPLSIRAAAVTLETLAAEHPSITTLHARGLALISLGQVDEAIAVLSGAVSAGSEPSTDASLHADLSAAWLEKWRQHREPESAAQALSEAELALTKRDTDPAGLFNRALSLTSLGMRDAAINAWNAYLAQESSGPWADEARRRLEELQARQPTRASLSDTYEHLEEQITAAWANPGTTSVAATTESLAALRDDLATLPSEPAAQHLVDALSQARSWPRARRDCFADAWNTMARSRTQWADANRAESVSSATHAAAAFKCAGFSALTADAAIARYTFLMGDRPTALRRFGALIPQAQNEGAWRTASDLLRLRALARLAASPSDAVVDYNEAISLAARASDLSRVSLLETNLAEVDASQARYRESWQHLQNSFMALDAGRPSIVTRYSILSSAVSTASRQGLAGATLALADALQDSTRTWARTDAAIFATLQRSRAYAALNAPTQAARELRLARTLVSETTEPSLRAAWQSEMNITEGLASLRSRPDLAASAIDDAIRQLVAENRGFRVADLLLMEGRARAMAQDPQGARAAWERGVAVFEAQRLATREASARTQRTAALWDLYGELIDATIDEPNVSLAYAEQSRARSLLDNFTGAAVPMPIEAAQAALREREAAVVYAARPSRLVIWTITRSTLTVETSPVSTVELARLVADQRAALRAGTAAGRPDPLATVALPPGVISELPHLDRIIVVPDGSLNFASFPALTLGDHTYLVQRVALVVAPSLSTFAVASARALNVPPRSITAFGFGDGVPQERLLPLPGVDDEIGRVGAHYANVRSAIGQHATPGALAGMVSDSDVVHLAAHAQSGGAASVRPVLWLAPGPGQTGAMDDAAIAALPLKRGSTVILGACDTALGRDTSGAGVTNLAAPFLVAGASVVVATLWPIADRSAVATFDELHRTLAAGASADAVSTLQRTLIGRRASPAIWAALEAYGGRS
jgi:CHAT domain-containing protein/tetratricopeptide (TPR) repeat protein